MIEQTAMPNGEDEHRNNQKIYKTVMLVTVMRSKTRRKGGRETVCVERRRPLFRESDRMVGTLRCALLSKVDQNDFVQKVEV